MADLWYLALLLQQGTTLVSSGFTALYFLRYRSPRRGRRWGALALTLVNLAFFVQGLYLGILPAATEKEAATLLNNPRLVLTVGAFPLAASFLISAFIIRRRGHRNNGA